MATSATSRGSEPTDQARQREINRTKRARRVAVCNPYNGQTLKTYRQPAIPHGHRA